MNFKIVNFDSATGQLVINVAGLHIAIDLPVDDEGRVPVGEALINHITPFIPAEVLRKSEILGRHGGVSNAEEIIAMMAEPPPEIAPRNLRDEDFITEINISSI